MRLGPRARAGAALLIYVALWIWRPVASQALLHPATLSADPRSPDPAFYVWALRWWPYAIAHGLDPLRTRMIGVPAGYDLTWTTSVPGPSLLVAPVTALLGPVVAFNLFVLVSIPAAALCAFLLCRRVTGTFWPALIGGYLFGFSPFELDHSSIGHINLMLVFLLPLAAWVVVLAWDGAISRRTLVVLLSLILAFEFLTSTELFASTAAIALVTLLLALAMAAAGDRGRLLALARPIALAYAVALLAVSPFLVAAATDPGPPVTGVALGASVPPVAMVIPKPLSHRGFGLLSSAVATTPPPSGDGYLGIPLVVVAVWFFVERRRTAAGRVMASLLLLLALAALGPKVGPIRLPWAVLWNLPLVDRLYPARLMVYASLIAALMVAMWLGGGRARWLRWTIAALAIASYVPYYVVVLQPPAPHFDPALVADGSGSRRLSGAVVLLVPDGTNTSMLWQAEDGMRFRVVGGFVNSDVSGFSGRPPVVAEIASRGATARLDSEFGAFLRSSGVTDVVVDPNAQGPWPSVLASLGLTPDRTAGVDLYRVPAAVTR